MSKYKIVICDDAAFIRTRLTKLIETHFPEAQVTGSYPDGEDILAHIKKEPIDILITDICMENIDGLAVAKYIYEKKLHTKVIIITGYQDFEYAQKALKYHTRALITKPIDTDEMINAVEESMRELSESLKTATEQSHNLVNSHRRAQQLLQLFSQGKISSPDLCAESAFSNSPFENTGYIINFYITDNITGISADGWDDFVLAENEHFRIYSLCTCKTAAAYIVFSLSEAEQCLERINGIVRDTQKSISLFNDAKCNSTIFRLDNVNKLLKTENFKYYNKYLSYLKESEKSNIQRVMDSVTDNFSADEFKLLFSHLLIYIADKYPETDLSPYYLKARSANESASGKELFLELHKTICGLDSENDNFAQLITGYIYNNISDSHLSLEMVSNRFGYSPEHFSRKFKKAIGITFQNYLTDFRIERAKKMLEDGVLSVVAISNKIGFRDPAYFSKVFKKKTGLLPKDWRNR